MKKDADIFNHTHDDIAPMTVGTFNITGIGECTLSVYPNAFFRKPHFHVYSTDHKFHTCIRLDKCRYYNRGFKNDILNNTQLNELHKILSTMRDYPNNTFYSSLVLLWNSDVKTYIKCKDRMPKYLLMKRKE